MIKYLKRGKDAAIRADDDTKVRATVENIIKDVEARRRGGSRIQPEVRPMGSG